MAGIAVREELREASGRTSDEARIEEELQSDRELARLFNVGTFVVSVGSIAFLLILAIPMGRTSPWLGFLSLYAISSRLLVFVARSALLFPRFLLDLDSPDTGRAGAALAVLERHREAILRPVLRTMGKPARTADIAAVSVTELARLAREREIEARRRAGRLCFIAWCVVTVVLWSTVFATGAGPAS